MGYAFNKPPQEPLARDTTFECAPIGQHRSSDGSPIYKIMVNLVIDETGRDVKTLSAVHMSAENTPFDQDNQYDNAKIWRNGNFDEWFWTGVLNNDSRRKMGGRLYHTVKDNWMYEEERLNNGKQEYYMTSYCHKVKEGAGLEAKY
jgi:hypothetical protein